MTRTDTLTAAILLPLATVTMPWLVFGSLTCGMGLYAMQSWLNQPEPVVPPEPKIEWRERVVIKEVKVKGPGA